MKTLIVDDSVVNRLLLQQILKNHGAVQTAESGKEAVEAVCGAIDAGEPFDLVCLDIMMPEMDGYDVLKAIRGQDASREIVPPHGAKIFMITALGGVENVKKAISGACDYYLVKPIDRSELMSQVYAFGLVPRP